MDKTIRRYTDFEEMKADEYRYWQSRPVYERVAAVPEPPRTLCAKGRGSGCTQTFKELLSVLNKHRVKYLVVGAYAVSIHAQPRATKAYNILHQGELQKRSESLHRD